MDNQKVNGVINIIIIDDQSLMRDGLSIILSASQKINVMACGKNGNEAIELTEKLCPDLVLMDIRMPEMDGVEASKIIMKKFPETKILLLTTFDDEELIISAIKIGVSGYVFKDIEKDKLISSIRDCVNGTFIMPSKVASVLARHIPDIVHEEDCEDQGLKRECHSFISDNDTEKDLHNNIRQNSIENAKQELKNNKKLNSEGNAASDKGNIQKDIEKLNFSDREMEVAQMIAQGFTNHQIASALYISDGTVKNYVSSIYGKTGIRDRTKLALFLKENGME